MHGVWRVDAADERIDWRRLLEGLRPRSRQRRTKRYSARTSLRPGHRPRPWLRSHTSSPARTRPECDARQTLSPGGEWHRKERSGCKKGFSSANIAATWRLVVPWMACRPSDPDTLVPLQGSRNALLSAASLLRYPHLRPTSDPVYGIRGSGRGFDCIIGMQTFTWFPRLIGNEVASKTPISAAYRSLPMHGEGSQIPH